MRIIRSTRILESILRQEERERGRYSLGFVPTMGALHEGHISLIRRARRENNRVLVSIFVNPLQFGPHEDFHRYPRPLAKDTGICRREGVDIVFLPAVREVLRSKYLRKERPPKSLSAALCGPFRPGHFEGVAAIVLFFFRIIRPDKAYFGEKDYQQLRIIEEVTLRHFKRKIEIVRCPTVREEGGLAKSSRNAYLSGEKRRAAMKIYKALREGRRMILNSSPKAESVFRTMKCILEASPAIQLDYLSIVDSKTLKKVVKLKARRRHPLLIATAVRIGKTRLIDNILV